jgi:3',5'-cyclic AMP phosphodiesterase CpdA
VTGDLTEDGAMGQFEAVAEELANSGIPPTSVTLVPGNHDIYSNPIAWHRALAGPLRHWARTSSEAELVQVGCASVAPIATLLPQSLLRSAGSVSASAARRLHELAQSTARAGRQLVIAQHHAPEPHWLGLAQWVDGLQGHAAEIELLRRHPHAYVLHGHSHRRADRAVGTGEAPRVFSAAAVVDASDPLRLYEVAPWGLSPTAQDGPLADPALAAALG